MKNAQSFVNILILLGICGYTVVYGLSALVHTHEHEPLSHSADDCAACFYQAHHAGVEIHAFELVLPNRCVPVPLIHDSVALPLRQNNTPLTRAPPSLPVHSQ